MKLPLTNTDLKKMYKRKVDNKMRSYGDTDLEKKVMRVNKKMSKKNPMHKRKLNKHASKYPEVLDSIVHETTHAKKPKMLEKNVRKHTKRIIKKMNKRQKRSYYNLFK